MATRPTASTIKMTSLITEVFGIEAPGSFEWPRSVDRPTTFPQVRGCHLHAVAYEHEFEHAAGGGGGPSGLRGRARLDAAGDLRAGAKRRLARRRLGVPCGLAVHA